jgi:hypothetical protein
MVNMPRRQSTSQTQGPSRDLRSIVRPPSPTILLSRRARLARRGLDGGKLFSVDAVRALPSGDPDTGNTSGMAWWTLLCLMAGTAATGLAMLRIDQAGHGPAGREITIPWLAGLAFFSLAVWLPDVRVPRGLSGSGQAPRTWAPWLALAALAAIPRLVWLDRFPSVIDGDESQYLLIATSAREGTMVNPFATGWLGTPHLYPAVAGWLAALADGGLAGHRLLSGLVGTIGVLAAWRFGRRVVGEWPALVGAALMAILPYHLYFSRSALNHATDPTTLTLALLFLWRGVHTGRRGDAFLCGAMVGLGWYGYWGARAYPLIVAALLVVVATDSRFRWRHTLRLALWIAIGFVATAAPLLAWFVNNPVGLLGRLAETSPFSIAAWSAAPVATTTLYLGNLRKSVLLPFTENLDIFYRHPAPFLGWPMAILLLAGVCWWLASMISSRAWRDAAWLLVPWGVLTIGAATTYPVQGQRFMAIAPIWSLLAGAGLVVLAQMAAAVAVRNRDVTWRMLAVGSIAVLATVNVTWAASEERQLTTYADARSVAAWDIGWRLAHSEERTPRVLFLGGPFMFIDDWGSVRFQEPEAVLTDFDELVHHTAGAPLLATESIMLLVPERAEERCLLEAAYPGAKVAEVRAWDGTLLYLAFHSPELAGWSRERSPAATTYIVSPESPCRAAGD